MLRSLALAAALACATPAAAEVTVRIDTSLADQALALTCSGRDVDAAAIAASPLVQAQVRHNSRLRPAATVDAYIEALRALSACRAPDPDPFGAALILADRDGFARKVELLRARQTELGDAAARRLAGYMPPGMTFRGDVVLAAPYFSCGGFAAAQHFFVDIYCLDENVESDFAALALLIAHETYHAIQERAFFRADLGQTVRTRADAARAMFFLLLIEGSASHVAPPSTLPANGGRYTRLGRRFHLDNAGRAAANFTLMTLLFEHILRSDDPEAAATRGYQIAFDGGTYQEMGYAVGARMAADIERAWGREALVCVMLLAPEQFALAHDAVAEGGGAEHRLGPPALRAARLAAGRGRGESYRTCAP